MGLNRIVRVSWALGLSCALGLTACGDSGRGGDRFSSGGDGGDGASDDAGSASGGDGQILDVGGGGSGGDGADGGTPSGTACEQAAAARSNTGCEFWAVDLPNSWQVGLQVGAEDQAFGIVVTNTTDEEAQVDIYVGTGATPVDGGAVPAGGLRVFTFDNAAGTASQGNNEGVAYRIASDVPVTAYQYNPLDNSTPVYSNDASLLFPTHVLDKDYTAITGDALWITTANGGAFVTAAALEDNTRITFYPTPGVPMYPGNNVVVLDKGETYTMMSNAVNAPWDTAAGIGNLSGTRVEADKPVAVFSGNVCSWEPTPMSACCCDHLEHQMLPLNAWGSRYLVSLAAPASGSADDDVRVRITGSFDGTKLAYQPGPPPGAPTTIGAYETVVFTTSTPFAVEGDMPFAVTQFLMSNEAVTPDPTPENPDDNFFVGDPAMILVPPAEQFQKQYVFQTPSQYASNWVTILRPQGVDVRLDGASKQNDPSWKTIATSGGTAWQYGHFAVQFGAHRVDADEPVGIIVAGYDVAVSYGFAGGSGVKYVDAPPAPPPAG